MIRAQWEWQCIIKVWIDSECWSTSWTCKKLKNRIKRLLTKTLIFYRKFHLLLTINWFRKMKIMMSSKEGLIMVNKTNIPELKVVTTRFVWVYEGIYLIDSIFWLRNKQHCWIPNISLRNIDVCDASKIIFGR